MINDTLLEEGDNINQDIIYSPTNKFLTYEHFNAMHHGGFLHCVYKSFVKNGFGKTGFKIEEKTLTRVIDGRKWWNGKKRILINDNFSLPIGHINL